MVFPSGDPVGVADTYRRALAGDDRRKINSAT